MNACKCGSYAINPSNHGRQEGVDLHLCDVCYWRERAKIAREALSLVRSYIVANNHGDTQECFAIEDALQKTGVE